jgi:hypothetical protein
MSRASNSSTRPDARSKRRDASSCAPEPRAGAWRRPYNRLRQELDSTTERLERSRRVIEAAEKAATTLRVDYRQLRDLRPMPRVHGWLCKTVKRLQRAALDVGETARILEHDFEAAASPLLAAACADLAALMRETVSLSVRFRGAIDSVLLARESGLLPEPAAEPVRTTTPVRRGRTAVRKPVRQQHDRQPLGNGATAFRTASPTRGPPTFSFPNL